jgi:hypothetical protein
MAEATRVAKEIASCGELGDADDSTAQKEG